MDSKSSMEKANNFFSHAVYCIIITDTKKRKKNIYKRKRQTEDEGRINIRKVGMTDTDSNLITERQRAGLCLATVI